jgi:hypothetical protein
VDRSSRRHESRLRQCKHAVEQHIEIGLGRRGGAENAAVPGDQVGKPCAGRLVAENIDADERNTLQCDAALPLSAHRRQHRPGRRGLRTKAVDMGANGARAVSIGAAQTEAHAVSDVLRRPMRRPVGGNGEPCRGVASVGVGRARPDMRLVEMGVDVSETGPHHAAVDIDRRAADPAAGRRDPRNQPALDGDVEPHGLAIARVSLRTREQRPRHRRVVQNIGRASGNCGRNCGRRHFNSRGRPRSRATCAAAGIRAPKGRRRSRYPIATAAAAPRTSLEC